MMRYLDQLDRPAWTALNTGWAAFALGGDGVLQLDPLYGPFSGVADRSTASLAWLAQRRVGEHGLWAVELDDFPCPPGMTVETRAPVVQMVAEDVRDQAPDFEVIELGEADAAEMLALAQLTKPGPYTVATHRLGPFIGVRERGQLVAMAGERMHMPGLGELSGVCTHPDFRGRRYGAALSALATRRILARGETAFLHAYAGNAPAIAIYEALGYRLRTMVVLTVLRKI